MMSQENDNRFKALIQPIKDLATNWDIDIAESLTEYLEELDALRISFNGKNDLNFAEAALLIQGSTTIYSKKVEYLHQLVLQALEFLSTKKVNSYGNSDGNNNNNNNSDGNSKNRRNNYSQLVEESLSFGSDPSFLLLDDIVEPGTNINLNSNNNQSATNVNGDNFELVGQLLLLQLCCYCNYVVSLTVLSTLC